MVISSMMLGYSLLALLIIFFAYSIYEFYVPNSQDEGFYPRQWGWGPGYGSRWGWRRPWLHGWGNWRPYSYYPAYSGYWKQCENGAWCPATASCSSQACQYTF
jgi:hypothetical protein